MSAVSLHPTEWTRRFTAELHKLLPDISPDDLKDGYEIFSGKFRTDPEGAAAEKCLYICEDSEFDSQFWKT